MVRKVQLGCFGSWSALNRSSPAGVKKQLHMGGARRLCSGHPPERSAWLDGYVRDPLAPARCAERPTPAREAGQHWLRGASGTPQPRHWPAVMTPRHAAPRANDAVASYRAADGAGPSIEGARTCAHFISRGAGAAFPAFRSCGGLCLMGGCGGLAHSSELDFFPARVGSYRSFDIEIKYLFRGNTSAVSKASKIDRPRRPAAQSAHRATA
eukprot:COSAG06_NODE_4575_length_4131_cov_3.121280_1_plen_210_part_10